MKNTAFKSYAGAIVFNGGIENSERTNKFRGFPLEHD